VVALTVVANSISPFFHVDRNAVEWRHLRPRYDYLLSWENELRYLRPRRYLFDGKQASAPIHSANHKKKDTFFESLFLRGNLYHYA